MKGFGNILIIGDSYSTFKGFSPEGYSYWYPPEAQDTPGLVSILTEFEV